VPTPKKAARANIACPVASLVPTHLSLSNSCLLGSLLSLSLSINLPFFLSQFQPLSPGSGLLLDRVPQLAAEDLARRALGDGVEEDDPAAELLVLGEVAPDIVLDLGRRNLGLIRHDVGTGQFVARPVGVRHADDGGVEDEVVADEERLEFGGGDLETFVFDEFLTTS
jgi:hypothetical protein